MSVHCGIPASLLLIASVVGCSETPDVQPRDPPLPLPALGPIVLTSEASLVPSHAVIEPVVERNPSVPEHRDLLLSDGFGEVELGDGEPLLGLTHDGSTAPSPGASPRLIARFVHLADTQLADDESPARGAAYDFPGVGAFRSQEDYECRILNASVRTINALHSEQPIDFVLLGGDNIDSAQQNELAWLLAVLSGSPEVKCDSGDMTDPLAGANNDGKDAFIAEGLVVPWLWVNGNHDILMQGVQPVTAFPERAVGTFAVLGTRDWRLPGGPVVIDDVIADPSRRMLALDEVLSMVAADGDGHGIDDAVIARNKANFVHDVPGSELRILVVDMASELGGTEGVVLDTDVADFIRPALDQAMLDGKLVIVASHHSANTLSDGGSLGGVVQPGAITEDDWQALLGAYPNVLAHLCGHSHIHRVHLRAPATGGPYWEVITSALSDYPHQMRVVEVWDQDNGFISVRLTSLDYATDGDPVAAHGRALGVLDYTSGWMPESRGEADDRNVELWVPKP